jgi:hypothetical protein
VFHAGAVPIQIKKRNPKQPPCIRKTQHPPECCLSSPLSLSRPIKMHTAPSAQSAPGPSEPSVLAAALGRTDRWTCPGGTPGAQSCTPAAAGGP